MYKDECLHTVESNVNL